MFDVDAVRQDFPILQRQVKGKPLVYLDSAATSQKPRQVIDAVARFYETFNANVHRGAHSLSDEATDAYEQVRLKVSRFIGAASPREIVFVRNATEAINLVAYSWARGRLGQGDEILLSVMEHHSNLIPWQQVAAETGAVLRFIPLNADGTLDLSDIDRLICERTKLVALSHISNVLGTINPIRQLADLAHDRGALLLADGAQSVPHIPVNVGDLGCDFLAFSGHKMLGPMGIGALYARAELLEQMDPFLSGGSMIREVTCESATWSDIPHKFEAGTPNVEGAVGLGTAIEYLQQLGMESIRQHEQKIIAHALAALKEIDGLKVYGPLDPAGRSGVISFTLDGVDSYDLAAFMDQEGIALRAGHHCCQPLMNWLNVPSTVRASFYLYNTKAEVDSLARWLITARDVLGLI